MLNWNRDALLQDRYWPDNIIQVNIIPDDFLQDKNLLDDLLLDALRYHDIGHEAIWMSLELLPDRLE